MRTSMRLSVIAFALWMPAAPAVRAGIYISADNRSDETRLSEFRLLQIRDQRGQLQKLVLNPSAANSPQKSMYLALVKELEAKEQAGTLTDRDRADLGGLYLRLGRDPLQAVRVLSAGGSQNFLVLCNLAVAHHELAIKQQDANRLKEAELTQRRALRAWPADWSDWTYSQWYINRRVECLHLKLLELRFADMRSERYKSAIWQDVDPLFPEFKMAGGEYEAGRTAQTVLDALPPDAPWLVRELMMTYPADARLYWLFGELLNAGGRVEDALQVLDDMLNIYQLSNVRPVRRHRRELNERATLLRDLRGTALFMRDTTPRPSPLEQENLLWALAPPPALSVPIAGPAATNAGWWATTAGMEELQREERFGAELPATPVLQPSAPPPPSQDSPQSALPDWRVLGVGFGAGLFVALVFGLQRNEWKRRRDRALARSKSVG